MHLPVVAAILIHVSDVEQGLAWYEQAFPLAHREKSKSDGFEFLRLGALQIEIVPADDKVSSGPSGTVVYWKVESLSDELARLKRIGAKFYRGPIQIEERESMCQVQDPWGNCIGFRGPAS